MVVDSQVSLWFSVLDELGSTLSAYGYSAPGVDEAPCQTPWGLQNWVREVSSLQKP